MADITRRPGNRLTRSQREKRAYRLVLAGSTAGAVAVVTGLLALITAFTWSVPFLAAIIAVVCFVMFRGMTSPRR